MSFDSSDLEQKIYDLLSIRAKNEQLFFEHFNLYLGRAGEFSSDPSQISSDPMLGLNSNPESLKLPKITFLDRLHSPKLDFYIVVDVADVLLGVDFVVCVS